MRIISGSKKGHSIFSHKDKDVRPLSDKNRETIFNILTHGKEIINSGFQIEKSNVLDLFAGTGSFSFEALSRGANSATMVENNDQIINLIYKSANKLGLTDQISVLNENACSFESISDKPKFNLVYIDPPYNKNLVVRSIKNILKKNLINKNSVLVIEEERKSKDILIPELKIERVKELGISKFSFYRLT